MDADPLAEWKRALGIGPDPEHAAWGALVVDARAGRTDAVAARLAAAGGPLVSVDPSDPSLRVVTFVHEAADASAVDLVGHPVYVHDEALTSGLMNDASKYHLPMNRAEGTDLWHRTFRIPARMRTLYQFRVHPAGGRVPVVGLGGAVPDAANPLRYPPAEPRYELPPTWYGEVVESMLELDAAPRPDRWGPAPATATPLEETTFSGTIAPRPRRVWAHAPKTDAPPAGLLIVHDGQEWAANTDLADTLDRLTAHGHIPPMVVLLVESHRGDPSELGVDEGFAASMATELVPWARERWGVPADAARTIVAGQSWGGLHAVVAGMQHPDVFGNVISQSGSLWHGRGATGWDDYGHVMSAIATGAKADVRFQLDVGTLEGGMVAVTRHLRDVLAARGYDVGYREFEGSHTWACWQHSLPDAIAAITRDWAHKG